MNIQLFLQMKWFHEADKLIDFEAGYYNLKMVSER